MNKLIIFNFVFLFNSVLTETNESPSSTNVSSSSSANESSLTMMDKIRGSTPVSVATSYVGGTASYVGDKLGIDAEASDLIFKYSNKDIMDKPIQLNITNENNLDELKKIWRHGRDLKIVTHGWISSESSDAVEKIRQAYLSKYDYNVITLDWSQIASSKAYPLPALLTYQVGNLAGQVLEKLIDLNFTQYDQMHMIGHSLGGHVSGATGASLRKKMSRITGLDPALPGFELILGRDMRLDDTDAEFVDIIHTAAGSAGYYETCGNADFYPNSGKPPQPGCFEMSINVFKTIASLFGCSHMRAHEYFSESILNPTAFKAMKCNSWEEYVRGKCDSNSTGDIQYMGNPTTTSANGIYYLSTNSKAPYGGVVQAAAELVAEASEGASQLLAPASASPSTSSVTT